MLPIVPILGVLGLGGLIFAASRNKGPSPAELQQLADKVTRRGPRGELVFNPDVADSLTRSLASQRFTFPDPTSRNLVNIKPDPSGAPISLDVSARGWASEMNKTNSILAPLYMAMATPAQRFLRAVPAGTEIDLAGPQGPNAAPMYAVLLYAGTIAKNLAPPGLPPGGGVLSAPPGIPEVLPPPRPGVLTLPAGKVLAGELPGELLQDASDLLANGTDPVALDAVATELEKDGFGSTAALLRKKAADLRNRPAQAPAAPTGTSALPPTLSIPTTIPGVPSVPVVLPVPSVPVPVPPGLPTTLTLPGSGMTVSEAQTILKSLGFDIGPTGVDGQMGPKTKAAIMAFQRAHPPLGIDGLVGPQTAAALRLASAGQALGLPTTSPVLSIPGLPSSPASSATTMRVNTASGVNIRSGPGTSFAKLGAIPNGTLIVLTGPIVPGPGSTKGWAPTTFNGAPGFAAADFLA